MQRLQGEEHGERDNARDQRPARGAAEEREGDEARRSDPGEPEKCPAFQFHKIYCTPDEIAEVSQGCRTAGIGCLDCKRIMIKHVVAQLGPITEKRAAMAQRPQDVEDILTAGNQAARQKASETMSQVRETLGL